MSTTYRLAITLFAIILVTIIRRALALLDVSRLVSLLKELTTTGTRGEARVGTVSRTVEYSLRPPWEVCQEA